MPYCGQCGVEVDAYAAQCPLCSRPLQATPPEIVAPWPTSPELPPMPRLSPAAIRLAVFEIVSLLLFTAIVTVISVDVFADARVDWSLRALVALAGGWCLVSILLYWYRSMTLMHTGFVTVTGVMLALLDLCNGTLDWFVTLTLPILALEFVLVGGLIQLRRVIAYGWANLGALALFAAGLLCLGVNMIVNHYLGRAPTPTWALVAMIALMPPILFLAYVHYRLRKQVNLGKYFHV